MTVLRRHLAWLASGWLAVQVAGVAAAPVASWRALLRHGDQECECPLEVGATCPMHHWSHQQDGTCKLRNAFGSSSDRALFALTAGVGVLPASTVSVTAFDSGALVATPAPLTILRSSVPEQPPPRR